MTGVRAVRTRPLLESLAPMFDRAIAKLEDSRANIETMRGATNTLQFKSAFLSFLSNSRAVTYALQRDGKSVQGFKAWYEGKQTEMRADELLRFVKDARTDDHHKGERLLRFTADYEEYRIENPLGDAIRVDSDGVFRIADSGTPRERRVPTGSGRASVTVYLVNAPQSHRGERLTVNDPYTVASLAQAYMEELVHEARTIFEVRASL